MSKRKLCALGYPVPGDRLDPNDETTFRGLVYWLEDQKIRHYSFEDRKDLADVHLAEWTTALQKYLKDLACPFDLNSVPKCELLDWLLGLAISVTYSENVALYRDKTAAEIAHMRDRNDPSKASDNPLDQLDFDSDECKKGISDMAKVLGISEHQDHRITLRAICTLIQDRLSSDDVNEAVKHPKKQHGKAYPLETYATGMSKSMGDEELDNAARALRLLHIKNMRDLQTNVNETIVAVQNLTANPLTDDKLGQIGR